MLRPRARFTIRTLVILVILAALILAFARILSIIRRDSVQKEADERWSRRALESY